jgi:hypothetical protein
MAIGEVRAGIVQQDAFRQPANMPAQVQKMMGFASIYHLRRYDFAISRRWSPELCTFFALFEIEQLGCWSRPVIGRPQGWRWRATAFGG